MLLAHLETTDLTIAYRAVAMLGALTCVYVMNFTSYYCVDRHDHWVVRYGNRALYAALGLAMLWSLSFSMSKGWEPWPTEVAILAAVDGLLILRAIAMHLSIHRRSGVNGLYRQWRSERGWPSSGWGDPKAHQAALTDRGLPKRRV